MERRHMDQSEHPPDPVERSTKDDEDWVDPRPLPAWTRGLPVLPIAVTAGLMLAVETVFFGTPDPLGYCFYAGAGLLAWAAFGSLLGNLLCGAYLALTRAPRI